MGVRGIFAVDFNGFIDAEVDRVEIVLDLVDSVDHSFEQAAMVEIIDLERRVNAATLQSVIEGIAIGGEGIDIGL